MSGFIFSLEKVFCFAVTSCVVAVISMRILLQVAYTNRYNTITVHETRMKQIGYCGESLLMHQKNNLIERSKQEIDIKKNVPEGNAYKMKESLKNFYNYKISDEELLLYIRTHGGEWNEESFIQMKQLVRDVINDYKDADYYPKVFVNYFVLNIPSVINILSHFRGCTDKEIRMGYTAETYVSMIAERINELKNLQLEFQRSLWASETFD